MTVLVTGTNFATVTDVNGGYTVRVPGSGAEIVYSYIGYQSQQRIVGSQTVINLALQESTAEIGAVVVTALGIKRDQKSLTYNVQQIAGDDISIVKDVSVVNSLVGKVAGVRINQSSSGTGGSTRVVMRGAKSLFGDNNVLYVLNGIPMMSLRSTQSDNYYEGAGVGDSDGISSINPDDIESLSVLTGASAAALYGNRGANGVILITTKKGSADHSTHVSYSNNTTFSNPFVTHQFQNTYGRQSGDFKSWGEKLGKPSSYDPNDFFQTGYNTQNTVSVASSSERSQSFVSAGSVNSRGIIPNNEYSRYNFTIRHGRELVKDKLELDTDFFFTKSESQNGVAPGTLLQSAAARLPIPAFGEFRASEDLRNLRLRPQLRHDVLALQQYGTRRPEPEPLLDHQPQHVQHQAEPLYRQRLAQVEDHRLDQPFGPYPHGPCRHRLRA